MAGWRGGERIYRHLFSYEGSFDVALMFIAICMSVPMSSYAQEGFLSIDCGYTGANYTDSSNLTWTADNGTYITTGESYEQPAFNSITYFGDSRPFRSFRVFREARNKYCYVLPTPGNSYLIRATFYMNETVLNETQPFQFILSLDATNWFTLSSGDGSVPDFVVIEEAVFHPQHDISNITNFCLQPVVGAPFISTLELRQLEDTMYRYYDSDRQYLALLRRLNLGVSNFGLGIRFPDDQYDRLWRPRPWWGGNVSTSKAPDNTTGANVYYVPPAVMQDGMLLNYTNHSEDFEYAPVFNLYSVDPRVYMPVAEIAFAVIYTEHLNDTDSELYAVKVTMDEQSYQVNFSKKASMQATPNIRPSSNTIQFGMQSDLGLTDGPTLNAMEVYGQYNYNFSRTNATDVEAITALKQSINLTDWQGDPCVPVPHNWLSCTIYPVTHQTYYTNLKPIEEPCGLNGTLMEYCTQAPGFIQSIFSVTTLNVSNLTNDGVRLFTQESANTSQIWLPNLAQLSIKNSGLNSTTLQLILSNFLPWLRWATYLDLSYNDIDNIPSDWFAAENLTSLNLSHNSISGEMSTFSNASLLEKLDLSYNRMSHLPSTWDRNCSNSLIFLDLSHNELQGSISSLDYLVEKNNQSLQEIYISNNNLGGQFTSTLLYFSGLPDLAIANFDQNSINGTLDLSTWYNALQTAASGNSSQNIVLGQLFSFVNNSITGISPNAETINSVMEKLKKEYPSFAQHYGILLGGNPYCNGAKSYIQRYLCRYNVSDNPTRDHKKNTNILIAGICGGILVLLLSTVTSATLWKLWKQVYALREIQRALSDRKVQPPFYQYNDLKLATINFHNDNKLGHGGFGIVYKYGPLPPNEVDMGADHKLILKTSYIGILLDETTVAVKKLFDSQGMQVLDDFLNEVVLITGIKHKNLVQLKGCCIKDKQRMLVYEYAEKGNLAQALWGSKVYGDLSWEQRFNICVGVARGLSYLHEELQPAIIHRDIKPENILLDNNFKPKIADFGMARHSINEASPTHYTSNIVGTLGYFSPEYASEGQLSHKVDVYSYGIVVLEIISGRKCINHSLPLEEVYLKDWVCRLHNKGMLFDVLQLELRHNCVVAEVIRAINIGLLCVQNSPENRPSMTQVVTMFLGSPNVNGIMDESPNDHHDFKDLLPSIDNCLESPTLETNIEEDSANSFLLDPNHQSSSSNYVDSKSSSRPLIELVDINGR